jgi:calcineurin-like phosphoesterase family protein
MSGNIFMFSDPHFGHTNMALKRGFETVEEHDEHIIFQWNKVVCKKDVVYILGDITMEKSTNYHILDRLIGLKKVVLGNHDKPQHVKELLNYVNSVCGMIRIRKCILTHAPIHPSEVGRFALNIHGHVHEESLDDSRYYNVSAEVINYTPIALEEILK